MTQQTTKGAQGMPNLSGDQHPKSAWLMNGMILAGIVMMVVAAAGIFLLNRAPTSSSAASGGPVRVGMRMDDFVLQDISGKAVHLSDYKGHPVLINAWATWCPPCRAEMPALNTFYQQYRERGFVILAVNAGETRAQAADYANSMGLKFPILLDPDEHLMDVLSIHDFPTSILIGSNGAVKMIHVGMFTPETLSQQLLPLLQ